MRAPMPILHLRALSQVFSLSAAQHASRSNNNIAVPMEQAQFECYLIQSSKLVGRHYVGFSHDKAFRLTQHNGEKAGGAVFTCKGRPWKFVATVRGFASKNEALSFELSWQRPKV